MNHTTQAEWTPPPSFSKRFWVGCAIVFLSAIFATITIVTANDAHRLAENSIETLATILDTRFIAPTSARDGDGAHFVTYTFVLNDTVITKEQDVPKAFHDSHPVGTQWSISVHPDAPRIHDLFAGQTRQEASSHLMISILTALFGVFLALSNGNLAILRARRNRVD